MTQEKLLETLNFITTVDCSDEQKKNLLEMAANTITLDKLGQLVGTAKETKEQDKGTLLKFTNKEILKVSEK